MHDVVIIGGGTAGTFAALRLADEGVDVTVVSAGPPSAIMSRGAAFCGRDFPDDPAFERLWRRVLPRMWQERDAYLAFDGAVVVAGRALEGAACVSAIKGSDVLVMDVPGLPGPSGEVLAWRLGQALGREVRSSTLKLQYAVEDFNLTPVLWARRFDEPESKELTDHLVRRLIDDPADLVLMPPILGVTSHGLLAETLQAAVKGKVLELLGGPGWPPGLRVADALRAAIAESGVGTVRAPVRQARTDGRGRITHVVTRDGEEIEGRRFVLATGGLPGGGLRLGEGIEETTLGLEVYVDGAPAPGPVGEMGVDPATLFGSELLAEHPILGAGVHTDEAHRPLHPHTGPVYGNLLACGSVVESCGGQAGSAVIDPGASAYTGWTVAGRILSEAG